ncbi:MAG: diadenylate cyclase CdaA [Planctomycetota bacterium]
MSLLDGVSACIELMIFSFVIYITLRFLHGTRGLGIMKGVLSIMVVLGIAILILSTLGDFSLPRLKLVAEEFVTAAVLALVIVFQPEIRRGLTRLGEVGIFGKSEIISLNPLNQGVVRMARKKIGALIVLQRSIGLSTYVEGAIKVNAEVSAHILESIFYPNSPLHDGAVIIQRNRIVAACCLMPLSEAPNLPVGTGTRHRAALGISEESDAVAVVVSEETGRISIAVRGELIPVTDAKDLEIRMSEIMYDSRGEESAA